MIAQTDEIVLALEPTTIAEWDVRDLLSGEPSAGLAFTTREDARRLLDQVVLSLPRRSPIRDLDEYAAQNAAVVRQPMAADTGRFDFHVMELPVSICVPAGRQLTRLRLGLDARTVGVPEFPVVAYDTLPAPGGELTSPVTWDLSGDAIGEGFTARVIWRVPRRVPLKVSASLLGEVQGPGEPREDGAVPRDGALRLRKAQFRSVSQYYAIPS